MIRSSLPQAQHTEVSKRLMIYTDAHHNKRPNKALHPTACPRGNPLPSSFLLTSLPAAGELVVGSSPAILKKLDFSIMSIIFASPTDRNPREVLDCFHRAMLAMSADDLADLHAVDAIYEFPLLHPARPARYQGREEIRAGFQAVWSAVPVKVEEICDLIIHETTDPEVIVAEQNAVAIVTATSYRFTMPSLLIMRVKGGLIVSIRDYSDALRGAYEMGRLPALVASLSNL